MSRTVAKGEQLGKDPKQRVKTVFIEKFSLKKTSKDLSFLAFPLYSNLIPLLGSVIRHLIQLLCFFILAVKRHNQASNTPFLSRLSVTL